uniref:Uncharacterized protein n=1 Tax=Anopheles culicifacies TaxID=139723 RepID=A0A182M0Y7_9DIPT
MSHQNIKSVCRAVGTRKGSSPISHPALSGFFTVVLLLVAVQFPFADGYRMQRTPKFNKTNRVNKIGGPAKMMKNSSWSFLERVYLEMKSGSPRTARPYCCRKDDN